MYFPAGSRCTWKGDWNTVGFFNSPVTQVADVTSFLEANANMAVESSSVTEPDVFSTASTRTVTLKIRTLIDRNDMNDINADIRHAWYVQMSEEPDASSITQYTLASRSGVSSAGAPGVPTPTGAPDPTADNATPPDPTQTNDWWTKLKESLGLDKLGAGLIGLGVGVTIAVGALVYISVREEV